MLQMIQSWFSFSLCSYTPLNSIKYFVSSYSQKIKQKFTTKFILEVLILSNSSINFNEMIYLKIQGTAMDTVFAPTHATISGLL